MIAYISVYHTAVYALFPVLPLGITTPTCGVEPLLPIHPEKRYHVFDGFCNVIAPLSTV